MADHPLRSATHRRLGGPLPHQLPNGTRTHPYPINLLPQQDALSWSYAVLAAISNCYSPDMGRLFTRYSPVRHSRIPERIRSFDLHVLSMPPAFILSQNQTLKFNCLKSLLSFKNNNDSIFFCYLLLTCFQGYFFKYLIKLTEITFHLHFVSNKISFLSYSVFKLLLPCYSTALPTLPRRQLVYDTTNLFPLSSIFSHFFQIYFFIFSKVFLSPLSQGFFPLPLGQLVYLTTLFFLCQLNFIPFFVFL